MPVPVLLGQNGSLDTTKRILLAFGVAILLLIGAGAAALLQTYVHENAIESVNHSEDVLIQLGELAVHSEDAEASSRRFILNRDPAVLNHARSAMQSTKQVLDRLTGLTSDSPSQNQRLRRIRSLIADQSSALATSADPAAVFRAFQSLDQSGTTDRLRLALADMRAAERHTLDQRMEAQKRSAFASYLLLAIRAFFALPFIILAGRWVWREFRLRADTERVLAAREEQYRQVVELAGDMILRVDAEGRFTFCNQALLATLHFTAPEIIGRSFLKMLRYDHRRAAQRFYLRQAVRKQKNTYAEYPILDGHGRERWVGQNVQLILENGEIAGFQAIAREITERKRAEEELEKSRTFISRIASTTPGILYVYDIDEARLIYKNHEFVGILGNPERDLQQEHHFSDLTVHPDDQPLVRAHHAAMEQVPDGEVRRIEYRARHAEGRWIWLSIRETAFERGPNNLVKRVVGIAQDVTERRAAQEKLTWQANYDGLTGLANRHHFRTRLESSLRRASLDHSTLSLCLFDVDKFKEVNDRFGHAAGDEVLEEIGNIVRTELNDQGFAGRLGGDEFCFALPGTDENEAARVAERIRTRLSTLAFGLTSEAPFSVSAAFGVAECHGNLDSNHLLEAADRALYRAKAAGRDRVCVDG